VARRSAAVPKTILLLDTTKVLHITTSDLASSIQSQTFNMSCKRPAIITVKPDIAKSWTITPDVKHTHSVAAYQTQVIKTHRQLFLSR
jgi:capsule polysaccharide modification protein KpsS